MPGVISQDAIGLISLAIVYDQVVPAEDAPLVRGHGDLITMSPDQRSFQALVMRWRVHLVDHYIRECVFCVRLRRAMALAGEAI